jgi:SAM-dependent methyltransferase
MHRSSYEKVARFRRRYLGGRERDPLRILDVGSQDVNGSYRPIFAVPAWTYEGLDVSEGPNVDIVVRSPYDWRPIRDASYDVVVSGQALEHVEFFWITLLEIARVLRPDGLCCLVAPSAGPEHRYPVDCWRYYPDGFRAAARWARLEPVEVSTEWDAGGYGDESAWWKDTMMVCRKQHLPAFRSMRRRLTDAVLLAALRDAAARRGP